MARPVAGLREPRVSRRTTTGGGHHASPPAGKQQTTTSPPASVLPPRVGTPRIWWSGKAYVRSRSDATCVRDHGRSGSLDPLREVVQTCNPCRTHRTPHQSRQRLTAGSFPSSEWRNAAPAGARCNQASTSRSPRATDTPTSWRCSPTLASVRGTSVSTSAVDIFRARAPRCEPSSPSGRSPALAL